MTTQPTTSLYDLTLAELEAGLVERRQPKYRAKQIFDWAYNHLVEDCRAMAASCGAAGAAGGGIALHPLHQCPRGDNHRGGGGDGRRRLRTPDERHVEAVLMFYPDRVTACISCGMGCPESAAPSAPPVSAAWNATCRRARWSRRSSPWRDGRGRPDARLPTS